MSKFRKSVVAIIIVEILLIVFCNVLITRSLSSDNLQYRIDAKQIAKRMETEHVEDISLSDYKTIVKIEPYDNSQVN